MRSCICGIFLLTGITFSLFAKEPQVTFLPHWYASARFAGYFVAYERGFYLEEGIELSILPGGPEHPIQEALQERQADFATDLLLNGIQARSNGVPLVNLAQMMQYSSDVIIAWRASNINEPSDLDGKTVSVWVESAPLPMSFFKKHGLAPREVRAFSANLFLRKGADAIWGNWYDEYDTVLNSGTDRQELTLFFLDEKKQLPADGIYCLEETFRQKPKLCLAFARASIRGWKEAFKNPTATLEVVLKYARSANLQTTWSHQKWMLEQLQTVICPEGLEADFGKLSKEGYRAANDFLARGTHISQPIAFEDFYVNRTATQGE